VRICGVLYWTQTNNRCTHDLLCPNLPKRLPGKKFLVTIKNIIVAPSRLPTLTRDSPPQQFAGELRNSVAESSTSWVIDRGVSDEMKHSEAIGGFLVTNCKVEFPLLHIHRRLEIIFELSGNIANWSTTPNTKPLWHVVERKITTSHRSFCVNQWN
jgi:hypothetical protein